MRILELLMRETLPQRNYFRASEVSDLLKIKPHEMRYWETEFPQIRPQKTRHGQRIYRRQDVIIFSAVKQLLQEKKLSLGSAQRIIAESDDLFSSTSHYQSVHEEPLECAPVQPLVAEHEGVEDLQLREASDELNDDHVLQEAATLLDEENETFSDLTHQIYQACADELLEVTAPLKPPSLNTPDDNNANALRCEPVSKPAYEETMATLKESKASLTEILTMLDKFHESNFWHNFKS